jgi:peptide/nickel transport system permease protein
MVLPVTSMVIWNVIFYFRISRASIIETLQEDFTTTARAKGLTENRVLFRHALRNALIPTVTVAGIMLGYIFTGAMVTETVFAWPGIGDLTLISIRNRDYPMLMGIFLITSISVLVFSFITDILYAYLDPRIRYK